MTGLRYVLRTGASVFGVSAIALIVFPAFFLTLLGLNPTPELTWSMVLIGVTLVALTGMMAVVSFFATDSGVRVASIVMATAAAGLGVTTVAIPVDYTWFSVAYAAVGFGFSGAYILGLLVASRSR
jgi:hypothetical protein